MKERLIKFINSEGLRPARFAEIMGIGASGVSHILSGRNKPNYDFIVKLLSKFPSLNPDWLILGQGEMYRSNNDHFPSHIPDSKLMDTNHRTDTHQIELFTTEVSTPPESDKVETSAHLHHNEVTDKTDIEKIIIIYSDGTFSNHKPAK